MPDQAESLEQLFQLEHWLEVGFVDLFEKAGLAQPFSTRSPLTAQAPFTSLFVTIGGLIGTHQYIRQSTPGNDGYTPTYYDAWQATLTTESVTNRPDDSATVPSPHLVQLGRMRKALTIPFIRKNWLTDSFVGIYDIRPIQTIDTFEDEDAIDHTQQAWDVYFRIQQYAWPVNLSNDPV